MLIEENRKTIRREDMHLMLYWNWRAIQHWLMNKLY